MLGHSVGHLELVGFEQRDFGGEAEGIIWSKSPLPRLTASHRGRNKGHALREQAEFRRTQSTKRGFGSRGRKQHSQKLTAAHSGSTGLKAAEDEPVAVYYEPRAFEELPELEEAA